jgi:RNA polymerase primary sigma factor
MRQLKIENRITIRNQVIERYFNDVERRSTISVEKELGLAIRISNGDESAINELVEANLKFVISVAKQYCSSSNTTLLSELIAQGNIGLIDAAKSFDHTRGFKFISYAVWHIRKEILHYLVTVNHSIRVPMNVVTKINKAKQAADKFEQVENRQITPEELSDLLKSEYDVDYLPNFISVDQNLYSDVTPLEIQEEEADSPIDVLESGEKTDSVAIHQNSKTVVGLMSEHLTQFEVRLIMDKLGMSNGIQLSWSELSKRTGRSEHYLKNVYFKSIYKLKIVAKKYKIEVSDFDLN